MLHGLAALYVYMCFSLFFQRIRWWWRQQRQKKFCSTPSYLVTNVYMHYTKLKQLYSMLSFFFIKFQVVKIKPHTSILKYSVSISFGMWVYSRFHLSARKLLSRIYYLQNKFDSWKLSDKQHAKNERANNNKNRSVWYLCSCDCILIGLCYLPKILELSSIWYYIKIPIDSNVRTSHTILMMMTFVNGNVIFIASASSKIANFTIFIAINKSWVHFYTIIDWYYS